MCRLSNSQSQLCISGVMLLGWMMLIFYLSHQPGSGVVWEPPLWYVLERKSAHVVEYAVLMFLAFRFFRVVYAQETLHRVLWLAVVFTLAYGVSDELHQFFIFGREARWTDILVDTLGIALAAIGIMTFGRRK